MKEPEHEPRKGERPTANANGVGARSRRGRRSEVTKGEGARRRELRWPKDAGRNRETAGNSARRLPAVWPRSSLSRFTPFVTFALHAAWHFRSSAFPIRGLCAVRPLRPSHPPFAVRPFSRRALPPRDCHRTPALVPYPIRAATWSDSRSLRPPRTCPTRSTAPTPRLAESFPPLARPP